MEKVNGGVLAGGGRPFILLNRGIGVNPGQKAIGKGSEKKKKKKKKEKWVTRL